MTELSRRAFLARSSAAAGGLALGVGAGCSGSDDDGDAASGEPGGAGEEAAGTTTAPPFDPDDWASVRAQFPLRPDTAMFAAYVLAAHPAPVAEAIARHRAGLDEDTHGYLGATEADAETAVHDTAAEYLGAAPAEVALTDSTTMGLGLLYAGLRVPAGREVLTTEHDFYSTHQAWALRAAREGDRGPPGPALRRSRRPPRPTAMVGRLMAQVTPATRVVAITWVHSGTGVRLPVRAIADALAAANAGPGARRAGAAVRRRRARPRRGRRRRRATSAATSWWRARTSGCSARGAPASCGAGPTRGGRSTRPSPRSSRTASASGATACRRRRPTAWRFTPGGYHSFEHRWALAEAFRFHLDIGRDRVAARTHRAGDRAQGRPGRDPRRAGRDAGRRGPVGGHRVLRRRRRRAVRRSWAGWPTAGFDTSVTPYADEHVRVGPSIVTTPEEVDGLLGGAPRRLSRRECQPEIQRPGGQERPERQLHLARRPQHGDQRRPAGPAQHRDHRAAGQRDGGQRQRGRGPLPQPRHERHHHHRAHQQRHVQPPGAGVAQPHRQRALARLRVAGDVPQVVDHEQRGGQQADGHAGAERQPRQRLLLHVGGPRGGDHPEEHEHEQPRPARGSRTGCEPARVEPARRRWRPRRPPAARGRPRPPAPARPRRRRGTPATRPA